MSVPRQSAMRAQARLGERVVQLRTDFDTLTDSQTWALFATAADLLTTLQEVFAEAP